MRIVSSLLITLVVASLAQVSAEEAADAKRAKHLQRMRGVAESIRVLADAEDADSLVKLRDESVLRYSDDTRNAEESSLWTWSNGGRPTAILAIEYHPVGLAGTTPHWLYEVASLSTKRIAAEREPGFRFTAKGPGVRLQLLPNAPVPADKESRRLSQMKQLRDRFSGFEKATEGRIELRPLTTPLVRYADADQKLIDGAIFTFANGTNPEVLLMLEAHQQTDAATWYYALVQLTGEPVTVKLDGEETWSQPGDAPPATRAAYINGWIKAEE